MVGYHYSFKLDFLSVAQVVTLRSESYWKDTKVDRTDSWCHVASPDNPTDVLSRGLIFDDLLRSHIWWQDPSFLQLPEDQYGEFVSFHDKIPVQRKICAIVAVSIADRRFALQNF